MQENFHITITQPEESGILLQKEKEQKCPWTTNYFFNHRRNFRNILLSLLHSLLSTKIRVTSENKAYLFAPFLHYQPGKEGGK